MDTLPIEILYLIATYSAGAYRALLAVPLFARSLTTSIRTDYMIAFGHRIKITKDSIEWRLGEQLHRKDGPAEIHSHGTEYWYYRDEFHRIGGPAITCSTGYEGWYWMGERHRDDGPAEILDGVI